MTFRLNDHELNIYGDPKARDFVILLVDDHEEISPLLDLLPQTPSLCLVTFFVKDWNQDLTPWENPPVFGKIPFGNGASNTLDLLCKKILPFLQEKFPTSNRRFYLCGYSLAGLFALWAAYQTDLFAGYGAVSPSVWYPGWMDYATTHSPKASKIYLSLGDREAKTKNPVMAQVGQAIQKQAELLEANQINYRLEWNPGNHFMDFHLRLSKGIAWLLS